MFITTSHGNQNKSNKKQQHGNNSHCCIEMRHITSCQQPTQPTSRHAVLSYDMRHVTLCRLTLQRALGHAMSRKTDFCHKRYLSCVPPSFVYDHLPLYYTNHYTTAHRQPKKPTELSLLHTNHFVFSQLCREESCMLMLLWSLYHSNDAI